MFVDKLLSHPYIDINSKNILIQKNIHNIHYCNAFHFANKLVINFSKHSFDQFNKFLCIFNTQILNFNIIKEKIELMSVGENQFKKSILSFQDEKTFHDLFDNLIQMR